MHNQWVSMQNANKYRGFPNPFQNPEQLFTQGRVKLFGG